MNKLKKAAIAALVAVAGWFGLRQFTGTTPPNIASQIVCDASSHPMTAQVKPALFNSYVDADLGGTVRRITDAQLYFPNEVDHSKWVIVPMYSTVPAWNADESYLLLYTRANGGTHLLLDGKTYRLIKKIDVPASDVDQLLWDQTNPRIFYYASTYPEKPTSPAALYSYDVTTDKITLIRDFRDAGCNAVTEPISLGHAAYMSWDPLNQYLGFQCAIQGHEDANAIRFIYNLTTNKVTGLIHYACGFNGKPACNGLAWSSGADGLLGEFLGQVYDNKFVLQRSLGLTSIAEHNSQGSSLSGHDTWNGVVFDSPTGDNGSFVQVDETTGALTVIIGPKTGWPPPRSLTHNSAIAFQKPYQVAISSVGGAPWGQGVLDSEIVIADIGQGANGTNVICRPAHHRSEAGNAPGCSATPQHDCWGYWGEPHVTQSPSGTRLLYASDWLAGASVDSYVVELPSYHP
jgi:hypothetical protein